MLHAYNNIWFCGLAASGKTTVLRLLNKEMKNIEFLNDSLEIINFVTADTNQKHHKKPTPDSFVLTDSAATNYSVQQLIKKAMSSDEKKVIELSRGKDTQNIVDFSYEYLFSNLPIKLKKNSLFIYIYAPVLERKNRNKARPKLNKASVFESFFCPEEAFDRFFLKDDFLEAVKKYPVDYLYIPNVYDFETLTNKIAKLFTLSPQN